MNIVFYYISDEVPEYAEYWMKSIRKFMPEARVYQLTDTVSPKIDGVNVVIRHLTKMNPDRDIINYIGFEFLSKLNIEEMVFVDPDFMFNGSIEHLLEGDFEVSVATRMRRDHLNKKFQRYYPYNSLIVTKAPRFWKDCYKRLTKYDKVSWFSNMRVVKKAVDSGRYKTKILDGNIYNKIPQHVDDYDEKAKVFHFKGRKAYMKPFYEKYIA